MKPKQSNVNPQVLAMQKKVEDKKRQELDAIKRKLEAMTPDDVLNELKKKKLEVYGNSDERLKRLKKSQGLEEDYSVPVKNNLQNKKSTVDKIKEIEEKRKQRRENMLNKFNEREEKRVINAELGQQGDVDFYIKIEKMKNQIANRFTARPYKPKDSKIQVCVRKRPVFDAEKAEGNIDCISAHNPVCVIHDTKFKVDGISKVLDNQLFCFDHSFGEHNTSEQVYTSAIKPLVPHYFQGHNATVFAYGQTGSGKTYTMAGMIDSMAEHIFDLNSRQNYRVEISFFEIQLAKLFDLLNGREKLRILEDSKGTMTIGNLTEKRATCSGDLVDIINFAFQERTTHSTHSNEVSSRSHAICEIKLYTDATQKTAFSKISIVDLAGSERGSETKSNDSNRRTEGAKINVSLLALKECIRSLANHDSHVPQRTDLLTKVLRDSFVSKKGQDNRIVMIACVSPCNSHADHSVNTLRYADRLNEREKIEVGFDLNQDVDEINDEQVTPRLRQNNVAINQVVSVNPGSNDIVKDKSSQNNKDKVGDRNSHERDTSAPINQNNSNQNNKNLNQPKNKNNANNNNNQNNNNNNNNNNNPQEKPWLKKNNLQKASSKNTHDDKENVLLPHSKDPITSVNSEISSFEHRRSKTQATEEVQELMISPSEIDINRVTEHDDNFSSSGSDNLNEDRDNTSNEQASASDQVDPDTEQLQVKQDSGKKSKSKQERDLERTLMNEQGEIPEQLKKQYQNVDSLYHTEEKLLDLHQSQMKKEADLIIEENDLQEAKNSENIELSEQIESLEKILEIKEVMNKNITNKIAHCKKLLIKEQNQSNNFK